MKAQKVCEEIINFLIAQGFRIQVSREDLKKAIMFVRGIDERTINRWLRALEVFEYVKAANPYVYNLNPTKIPKLMTLLKEKSQSKLL